jgi:hypothetical protein
MGKSEFFSFGDEDLGEAPEDSWTGPADLSSTGTLLVDPGQGDREPETSPELAGVDLADFAETAPVEKGTERPRGDSYLGSSEKRQSSSRRVQGAVVLALIVAGIALARIALAPAGTEPQVASSSPAAAVPDPRPQADETSPSSEPVEASHRAKGRQRGAEQQRVQQKRSQTRQRARRRRAPHGHGRAKDRRPTVPREVKEVAPPVQPANPPESLPPEPEPELPASAPEVQAAEADSSGEVEIQDGSSSPEFGL